ncbi:hypothetical protein [Streptomyces antimycoticus]|uniref:hypothetical protein n=1 Tax=Streptomyces antimycoticus TaxID=68175 RepID=UPI001D14B4A4|nr:hypothetical protein [Streptomyces antimycoticus]
MHRDGGPARWVELGPEPRGLVRQVVEALPDLLADHFAERLAADGPDVEITEPLTVTVRPGRDGRPGRTAGGGPPVEVHFAPVPMVELPADAPTADAVSFEESFAAAPDPWTAPSPAALFAELAERGELDALLALLPDASVRAYLFALLGVDDTAAARLLAELLGRAHAAAPPPAGPHGEAARSGPAGLLPERLRAAVAGADAADLPRLLADFLASADRAEAVRLARPRPVRTTRAPRSRPARRAAPARCVLPPGRAPPPGCGPRERCRCGPPCPSCSPGHWPASGTSTPSGPPCPASNWPRTHRCSRRPWRTRCWAAPHGAGAASNGTARPRPPSPVSPHPSTRTA